MPEKHSSHDLNNLLDSARKLNTEGKTADAIALLESNDAYSDSPRLRALTAHFHFLLEQYDTAVATARRALEHDSKNRLALQTLGEIAMKTGRYEDAETWFRETVTSIPQTSRPYLRLAASLIARQKWTDAANTLYKALETFSGDMQLLDRLQYVLTMDGRVSEADYIRKLRRQQASADDPDLPALLNRFEALEKPRAITQLKLLASMENYKNEPVLHARLARYLMDETRFSEAVSHLETVLKHQTRNMNAKLNLAYCLFKTGMSTRGWDIVNSIESYRDDAHLNYVKIEGLMADQKLREALEVCMSELERNPRDRRFRKLLKILKDKGAHIRKQATP